MAPGRGPGEGAACSPACARLEVTIRANEIVIEFNLVRNAERASPAARPALENAWSGSMADVVQGMPTIVERSQLEEASHGASAARYLASAGKVTAMFTGLEWSATTYE